MWLLAGSPKFSKINKNTKMFTKWVAVARKSLSTTAFCVIFRAPPHGDAHFGQNPYFWQIQKIYFLTFFHDFELKFWFFLRKKTHFGQKSRKIVIFRSSWTHTSVGKHPITIIFSFTHQNYSLKRPPPSSTFFEIEGGGLFTGFQYFKIRFMIKL